MTPSMIALLLAMVAGFSAAQLLFKRAAQTVVLALDWRTLVALATNVSFVGALILYGIGTLLYLYVLQRLPLSRAYAVFALQFVLVPLLGVVVFGEAASLRLALGAGLIVLGILVAAGA